MTGFEEMTLGHTSWTQRKIDPYWNDDRECIVTIQDAIAATRGCTPDWYDYDVYWQPYIDAVWPGGAPDECKTITHWELSVILKKLGLT